MTHTTLSRLTLITACLLLAACGSNPPTDGEIPVVDAQISTPLPAPQVVTNVPSGDPPAQPATGDQPAANQPPAQDSPPPGDISVDFNGVTFELFYKVAGGWSAEWVQRGPAFFAIDGSPLYDDPAKTVFTFENYALSDRVDEITFVVYPLEALVDINEAAATELAELQTYLATNPLPDPGKGLLPLYTNNMQDQIVKARIGRLDFRQGSGVRFLTAFSRCPRPITNDRLTYVYQGISGDGQWYVKVLMPVSTTWLDDGATECLYNQSEVEAFTNYVRETEDTLNDAPNDSFTPTLEELDALVRSIGVGG